MAPCEPGPTHVHLGTIEYGAAWALQQRLCEQRQRGEIGDVLLTCEHPDVITVGRRQSALANILAPRFPVFAVERGGDVTYHGPGQLVGYPILQLAAGEQDLHGYLRRLEEAVMALCARCGVPAARREGYTGVWTRDEGAGQRKLASLGVAVRRWVTSHGFALNVTTDLSRFAAINPCGMEARVMTSLAAEGGRLDGALVSVPSLLDAAVACLSQVLERRFTPAPLASLGESVGGEPVEPPPRPSTSSGQTG